MNYRGTAPPTGKADNRVRRTWFFAWSHRWNTMMLPLKSVLIHTRSDTRCTGHIPRGIISLLTSRSNKRQLLSKGEPVLCLLLHFFLRPLLRFLNPQPRTSLINSIHQRRFQLDRVQVIPTSRVLSQVVYMCTFNIFNELGSDDACILRD